MRATEQGPTCLKASRHGRRRRSTTSPAAVIGGYGCVRSRSTTAAAEGAFAATTIYERKGQIEGAGATDLRASIPLATGRR